MIFDVLENAYTVLNANFATDLAGLASTKGVGITTTAGVIKRQRAETFVGLNATLPAIGLYALGASMRAKDQAKRDSLVTLVFDYYATGTDPELLAKQAELAAEAVLLTIDRLYNSGGGIFGAGEADASVTVELDDAYLEVVSNDTETARYAGRARVTVPVADRDTV